MKFTKAQRVLLSSSLSVFLAGCGSPNYSPSEAHITVEEVDSQKPAQPDNIPPLVKTSPTTPALESRKSSDTYDVIVTSVPVRDLLFALARDSGLNMDIDDKVGGLITMSALDQTLDAILARIGEQVDIRVDRLGDALIIKPDEPYHQQYRVDFLNIARSYSSSTSSSGAGEGSGSVDSSGSNNFWEGLSAAIETILDVETSGGESSAAAVLLEGEQAQTAEQVAETENRIRGENSYYLSPETGVLLVYAPQRLQKEIESMLDSMVSVAKRQVLLEATVVEVVLNNQYEQGIDWALFNSLADEGLSAYQGVLGGPASAVRYITQALTETFTDSVSSESFLGDARAALEGDKPAADRDTYAEARAIGADAVRQFEAYERRVHQRAQTLARARAQQLSDGFRSRIAGQENTTLTDFTQEIDREVTREAVSYVEGVAGSEADEASGTPAREAVDEVPPVFEIVTYEIDSDADIQTVNQDATRQTAGGLIPTNPNNGLFSLAFRKGDLSAAVQLLDQFGDARVLSSPRISALNYQPALLRVVDQEVYFDISVSENVNPETGQSTGRNFDVSENTVDIGFAMSVLPQISEDGEVVLSLKPSVRRVLNYRNAPVPAGFGGGGGTVQNLVPITRVRELESVIALRDGEVAVLGGLLEDRTGDNNSSVPGLSKLPGVGTLFEKKSESTFKTEFVVFIRARIINNPSINGDYSDFRNLLPDGDFLLRDREQTLLPPRQQSVR